METQLLNFVPNLRCPISGQKLKAIKPEGLRKLNTTIEAGKSFAYEGEKVTQTLDDGLVTTDGQYIYPVWDGCIAGLLPSKAILAGEQLLQEEKYSFPVEKKAVMDFYDDFGWVKTDDGYNDTLTFEDRRVVSGKYWSHCHLRLKRYLPGGKYLLDIASGSVPNDEYLTFSDTYEQRICIDFSLLAMKEAVKRLKGRGIFILGDMTCIPIADGVIDSVISMHTVYHIPMQEQTQAVRESHRVLKPGGQAVIVYSWKKPVLMRMAFGMWRPLLNFYKRLRGRKRKKQAQRNEASGHPELWLYQRNYQWFLEEVQKPFNAHLSVYSAISRSFSNTFIQEKAFGRQLSTFIFWLENKFPQMLGRWGQYPVFVLNKINKPDRGPAQRKPAQLRVNRRRELIS